MNRVTKFFISQAVFVFLALIAAPRSALWAQSGGDDINSTIPIQSDWDGRSWAVYQPGDKIFVVNIGGLLPLGFTTKNGAIPNKIFFGGTMSLSYWYFLTGKIFIGGDIQGAFNSTVGKNFLFMVPFMAKVGIQWVMRRFEFPVAVSFGGIGQSYIGYTLISMILKAQGAAYFRFNNDWSFGLNVAGWMVPQITKESEKNATGFFLEISLSARYHF